MKTRIIIFVGLAMALLVTSCGGPVSQNAPTVVQNQPTTAPVEATAATKEPAIVKIGWTGGPDSLNPGVAWLAKSYTIFELVYESMYEVKLDGTYADGLVESVKRSEDGLVYTFTIKEGHKWHDGQPLTAKDVAFTYNLVKAHEDFPTLNSYTTNFVSVEAPDDKTVVITLDQPVPSIESKLVFLYILPEHIWKTYTEGVG